MLLRGLGKIVFEWFLVVMCRVDFKGIRIKEEKLIKEV